MLLDHLKPRRACASVHYCDAAQVQQLRVDARLLRCNNCSNRLMSLLSHCSQQFFSKGFGCTTTFRHIVVRFT
jgi:hypothetical protein